MNKFTPPLTAMRHSRLRSVLWLAKNLLVAHDPHTDGLKVFFAKIIVRRPN